MANEIIKDYGKTIGSETYNRMLQIHPYIPQADEVIKDFIKLYCGEQGKNYQTVILDLGCGPGRLTSSLGFPNSYKIGLDISQDFINHAFTSFLNMNGGPDDCVTFQQGDFLSVGDIKDGRGKVVSEFDVILMQGVMHHIHGSERKLWLKKCHSLLNSKGKLIVGDEFIREYADEAGRRNHVLMFYLHIIAEALKGGSRELAQEESKNLMDDVFSETEYAGFATSQTFSLITQLANEVNGCFYKEGMYGLDAFPKGRIEDFLDNLKHSVSGLLNKETENFNRGDYKVSVQTFIQELETYGFRSGGRYEIGPVPYLGGMGVLVFKKQ